MTSPKAATRRAALAAFLLFAAALFVIRPAEASRTTTDARPGLSSASSKALASPSLELSPLDALEPLDSIDAAPSPRFGFGEDLGLLDPEAGPGGFVVFARELSRCELTYARNNPLKFVDRDGRANDWAYGPFSDNNPKAPIQWNSVTPQQKAVEGTLAAITTVVAVAPVAVAAPAVFAAMGDALLATAVAHQTATAVASATVELAAGAAGAGSGEAPALASILKPAGQWIGRAGDSGNRVRLVGQELFKDLSSGLTNGARIVEKERYPGTMFELPGGGYVGLRPVSKSGPPTIDVNAQGIRLEIKLDVPN